MRKSILGLLAAIVMLSCSHEPKWELVWEENFEGTELDVSVWSRIPRGKPDWQNTQSFDDRCYEMRDGKLILKGIVNDDLEADTAAYLTGGIWTKHKKSFHRGRIEVCAKLQAAKGAWPAIWMMPFETDKYQWPMGGEVDIMERLNFDTIAYQTIHTNYTVNLGIKDNPPYYRTAPIKPDDFNVFGVDFWPDSLVFHINGVHNFTYPRIETDKEGQFPFDIPQYLLIDMQLGGAWVGSVDPNDLPVEMEVDWVRYYQWK